MSLDSQDRISRLVVPSKLGSRPGGRRSGVRLATSVLTWRATLRRSRWRPRDPAGRSLHRPGKQGPGPVQRLRGIAALQVSSTHQSFDHDLKNRGCETVSLSEPIATLKTLGSI